MPIEPRPIFAKDIKPGMVVTPWRQVESNPQSTRCLEVELVSPPTWNHSAAGVEVCLAGWALNVRHERVWKFADSFAALHVFAVTDEEGSDV